MKRLWSILLVLLFVAGCRRPYQAPVWEEPLPNNDVYVQPLTLGPTDGASDKVVVNETAKPATVEEDKAVAVEKIRSSKRMLKRINIPTSWQSLGRAYNTGQWSPSVAVVQVDRSIVTREWTDSNATGTSAADQALSLESKDSVNFKLPCLVMARISDSALYRYKFGLQALDDVLDKNVRPLYISVGTTTFKQWDGGPETEANKVSGVDSMVKPVKDQVSQWGIEILMFGLIGGPIYDNANIQTDMDKNFTSAMAAEVEKQKNIAQATRNKITVETADAEVKSAEAIYAARQAQEQRVLLESAVIKAKAALEAAKKWNGKLPRIMPADMVDLIPLMPQDIPAPVELPEVAEAVSTAVPKPAPAGVVTDSATPVAKP